MKMRSFSIGALTLLLLTFFCNAQANAHSSMIDQIPKGNSIISELPARIELTFDEELLDLGSGNSVVMSGPDGVEITTGPTVLLSSKISRELIPSKIQGKYSVKYRIVSADGHVVEGKYQFELKPKSESKTPTPLALPSEIETSQPQVTTKAHVNHPEGFLLHHRDHIILGALALLVIGIWGIASRRKWRELPD
jgi:methionine-rich copper-binding protein CopC